MHFHIGLLAYCLNASLVKKKKNQIMLSAVGEGILAQKGSQLDCRNKHAHTDKGILMFTSCDVVSEDS